MSLQLFQDRLSLKAGAFRGPPAVLKAFLDVVFTSQEARPLYLTELHIL